MVLQCDFKRDVPVAYQLGLGHKSQHLNTCRMKFDGDKVGCIVAGCTDENSAILLLDSHPDNGDNHLGLPSSRWTLDD